MNCVVLKDSFVERNTAFAHRSGISTRSCDVRAALELILATMDEHSLSILQQYFHDGLVGWNIVELLERLADPTVMHTDNKRHAAIERVAAIEWSLVKRALALLA